MRFLNDPYIQDAYETGYDEGYHDGYNIKFKYTEETCYDNGYEDGWYDASCTRDVVLESELQFYKNKVKALEKLLKVGDYK